MKGKQLAHKMENKFEFSIKGIEIVNSMIKAPPEGGTALTFNFDMQFRTIPNAQENVMTVFSDVVIKDLESKVQVGQYSAVFHYSVIDLGKLLVKVDRKNPDLPEPLLRTLLGISASTLRGLMFGAFKGTFLHNAILPVLDIMALQPELMPMPN